MCSEGTDEAEFRGFDTTNLGATESSKCGLFRLCFERWESVRIAPRRKSHGPTIFDGRALPILKGEVTAHCKMDRRKIKRNRRQGKALNLEDPA